MKKIFLISFLLASILSFGQHSGYTKQNLKMQWIAGAFDSTLHIPAGSGSPSGLRTGAWTGSGAVYVDTTNNVLYFYSGGSWRNSGSATAYVDSLYNSNDSLIYVKNGNAFYIGNLSNTTVVSNQGNHVLSGMVVSYISGLTYHVGPGYYMIEQVVYHFTGGDVTLDAADGSDARLDLIYIDNTMTLGTIDGTPGETTVTPIEDATTQLGLTTALVAALATTPSNIIDTVIRDEGSAGEWTISKTMTTNDSYSTNPYHGSISQRITGASTGQYIEWIAGSVQSKLRYTNLVFYIRNNSALSSARTFRIGLYNGTTSVGNVLNASLYGYDRAVTGTYMVVAFPMGDFGGADAFDRVRLQNTGIWGTIDVQVDYIRLQANGANNVGSSGVTNITATNNYAQNWTITNPTTTPNISLQLDTSLLATKLALKKSIDSVVVVSAKRFGIEDSLQNEVRTFNANDRYFNIENSYQISLESRYGNTDSNYLILNSEDYGNGAALLSKSVYGNSSIRAAGGGVVLTSNYYGTSQTTNDIIITGDSTTIRPFHGQLNIDSLRQGSSSDSVLVWSKSKGMVGYRNASSFGGGSSTLSGLTDVNISSPANLQLLQYQSGDSKWHNWTPNYISGSVASGQIPFGNGTNSVTSSGELTWDNTAHYLGIGTVTPAYKLDVAGTGRFTGALKIGAYTLPNTDGTSNQVLKTDGSGNVSWQAGGSGINHVDSSFKLTNDSLLWRNYVNVKDFGAVGDGVTNNTAAFQNAVNTGMPVYVPPGTYLLSTQVNLKPNQTIFGKDWTSIIKVTGNVRGIVVDSACTVKNLKFIGAGKAGSNGFNTGVFIYYAVGGSIEGCMFEDFSGDYVLNGGGGIFVGQISPANSDGWRIHNNYFYKNDAGLNLATMGEYVIITDNTFGSNNCAILAAAGNLTITGNVIQNNTYGIKSINTTNGQHSIITSNLINHNTYPIWIEDCSNGFSFSSNMVYYGAIYIKNSTNIKFSNFQFGSLDSIHLDNSSNIYRIGGWMGNNLYGSKIPIKKYNGATDFTILGEVRYSSTDANRFVSQVNADSIFWKGPMYHTGVTPSSTSAFDSVWVKDASTGQYKLMAQTDINAGGLTSIGTINSQSKAINGAVISGSVLYMQDADDTHSGLESSSHHSFVDSLISHTSVIRNSLATGDSLLTKKNDSTLIARKLQLIYEGVNAQTTGSNDSLLKITIPYDTIALATFGAGGGQAGDTAAFSTTSLYGSFFNDGSDTLVITKLIAVMQGTSDTLSVRVQWNDSINVSGTKLVNTPSPINNNYTGNSVTTFDNTKIPPGNWVWCDSPTVIDGRKPKYLSVTLIGYKKRKQ